MVSAGTADRRRLSSAERRSESPPGPPTSVGVGCENRARPHRRARMCESESARHRGRRTCAAGEAERPRPAIQENRRGWESLQPRQCAQRVVICCSDNRERAFTRRLSRPAARSSVATSGGRSSATHSSVRRPHARRCCDAVPPRRRAPCDARHQPGGAERRRRGWRRAVGPARSAR